MTEYPYGRSGTALCFYRETVKKEQLQQSGRAGDNELVFNGQEAYLYEAPEEDDPGRGHFSKWKHSGNGIYKQTDGISGDDGMCYDMFQDET